MIGHRQIPSKKKKNRLLTSYLTRDYIGSSKQLPWMYWPKKLLISTSEAMAKNCC